MRLPDRIEAAALTPGQLAAFRQALEEVVGAGRFTSMEHVLLAGLFDRLVQSDEPAAPLEDLWPHADLVLAAALTIAVTDGSYGLDEARAIGSLASRLGYSASALAALEARVLDALAHAARSLPPGHAPVDNRVNRT